MESLGARERSVESGGEAWKNLLPSEYGKEQRGKGDSGLRNRRSALKSGKSGGSRRRPPTGAVRRLSRLSASSESVCKSAQFSSSQRNQSPSGMENALSNAMVTKNISQHSVT